MISSFAWKTAHASVFIGIPYEDAAILDLFILWALLSAILNLHGTVCCYFITNLNIFLQILVTVFSFALLAHSGNTTTLPNPCDYHIPSYNFQNYNMLLNQRDPQVTVWFGAPKNSSIHMINLYAEHTQINIIYHSFFDFKAQPWSKTWFESDAYYLK